MKLEDIKDQYKFVPKYKEAKMKENKIKKLSRDIAKEKLDEATSTLKQRIDALKEMEKKSGAPLSSEKVLGFMADVEKEFLATEVYGKLQLVTEEIRNTLDSYNLPINTMKKQISQLIKNHEEFVFMISVSRNTVKAVGWILGTLVTLFTLFNFLSR